MIAANCATKPQTNTQFIEGKAESLPLGGALRGEGAFDGWRFITRGVHLTEVRISDKVLLNRRQLKSGSGFEGYGFERRDGFERRADIERRVGFEHGGL